MASVMGNNCMEELLNCSICCLPLIKPKKLPCDHTFCADCVKKLTEPNHTVTCPTCRQGHHVQEVRHDFQREKFVDAIAEQAQALTMSQQCERPVTSSDSRTGTKCEMCESKSASQWCDDCEQVMCDRCATNHIKAKFARNHKPQPLSLVVKRMKRGEAGGGTYCEMCESQSAVHWCEECEQVLCERCTNNHFKSRSARLHNVKPLATAVKELTRVKTKTQPKLANTGTQKLHEPTVRSDVTINDRDFEEATTRYIYKPQNSATEPRKDRRKPLGSALKKKSSEVPAGPGHALPVSSCLAHLHKY